MFAIDSPTTEATEIAESGAARRSRDLAQPTPFVLVSTRRSGSTWAADMIGSHDEVTCYGDIFSITGSSGQPPLRTDLPWFFDTLGHLRRFAFARPIVGWRYANRVFRGEGEIRAVGCKLAYGQFRILPWLLVYLAVKRVRVVHLVRRNKLDHLLSIESAKARGRYHAYVGERVTNPPVRLDTTTLVKWLDREEYRARRTRRMLALLRVPVFEVGYEELLRQPERYAAVLSFIGVEPAASDLRSRLQKWNRAGYRESIANYEEVRATLRGTKYFDLLEASADAAAG